MPRKVLRLLLKNGNQYGEGNRMIAGVDLKPK
jgi:hypothetical protein